MEGLLLKNQEVKEERLVLFFMWKFIGNLIKYMHVLSQHILLAVLTVYRSILRPDLFWQIQNSVFIVQ